MYTIVVHPVNKKKGRRKYPKALLRINSEVERDKNYTEKREDEREKKIVIIHPSRYNY
jgi:hypothetical protein